MNTEEEIKSQLLDWECKFLDAIKSGNIWQVIGCIQGEMLCRNALLEYKIKELESKIQQLLEPLK